MTMKHNLNAIAALAYRDLMKFLRDRPRLISTFIFPVIFIITLGGSLQANLGESTGYNFMTFVFTGVFAQTMFQSATMGIVSILDDRENDFSQEIFVSPISRYSIVFGKILGESLVALAQGVGIIALALILGIPFSVPQLMMLGLVAILVCLFAGSFGLIVISNFQTRRTADMIFNFVMLPQFFLAGVFAPIKVLPIYLEILSRLSPMRYAVDLTRGVYYTGHTDYSDVVLAGPAFNLIVMGALFSLFLVIGTILFVRNERNR
jgi:ABC-2 type transport system permease protein